MRIVHIISSLEMGGAQAVVYDLVRHFHAQGYEQTVIYFHDGPYREKLCALGIPLFRVHGIISVFDPVAFFRLMMRMRSLKPDVVHTILWAANWLGRLCARLLSLPCISSLHNNYDQNGFVRTTIDRILSYQTTHVVAVSEEVKASFHHIYPSHPVAVIHNGIDSDLIKQHAAAQKISREDLSLSADHFVIGTVGRFHPVKQYPLLLDTFALVHMKYPHARLIIVGQGNEEHALKEYARSLSLDPYIRWIVGKQAYGYYPLFDCFAMASSKEGISIALLEAMSLGIVPAITYHVAQHPVVKTGVNGCVAKCNNATDFASKIGHLIEDDSMRSYLQKNAQHIVRDHFVISHMIAAYNRLFRIHTNVKHDGFS